MSDKAYLAALERVEELRRERDALAAHVEDWRQGIALAKDWHWARDERGYFGCQKEGDEFLDWLANRDQNDAPETSLARLKAQWQMEAMLWAHDKVMCHGDQALDIILDRASDLRRQAEEVT